MSVEIQVFLAGERMPTPEQWAETLRAHGFDVDLDTDFDVRDFSGFLPCKYKGVMRASSTTSGWLALKSNRTRRSERR